MAPILETPRLTLREMTRADLDFVARMLGDPEVMRFCPHPLSREEALAWIERQRRRYAEGGYGLWLAVDRSGPLWNNDNGRRKARPSTINEAVTSSVSCARGTRALRQAILRQAVTRLIAPH